MPLQFGEVFSKLRLFFAENSIHYVLKKIAENVAPVAAKRVDMNDRVYLNVEKTGGAKHLVCFSSEEQVDSVVAGCVSKTFTNWSHAAYGGSQRNVPQSAS
jgi:hypothetical protein